MNNSYTGRGREYPKLCWSPAAVFKPSPFGMVLEGWEAYLGSKMCQISWFEHLKKL